MDDEYAGKAVAAGPGYEPSDVEGRVLALDRAIEYHQRREGTPETVIATAAVFFAYLKNGASE